MKKSRGKRNFVSGPVSGFRLKELLLGSLERPQVLFDSEGRPRALFAAAADGPGGFQNASNTWNQVFLLQDE